MFSRRAIMLGGLAAGAVAVAALGGKNQLYAAITEDFSGGVLTVQEAHAKALSGEITLVDIRRPDEWARTGSGQGAHRLDLRRDDFPEAMAALVGGDLAAPIALICARGVRSARESNRLQEAGFTNIIDVPEGMLGSRAGPGWIESGLPLVRDE